MLTLCLKISRRRNKAILDGGAHDGSRDAKPDKRVDLTFSTTGSDKV
jgi:hypothetical protein